MKQEHLFVAELYRYLAPSADARRKVYLSLDGEAAKKGRRDGEFLDADVPDLWFTLLGDTEPVLLEAKIMNPDGTVTLGQGQLFAWRSEGNGKHKPTAWVTADESFTEFGYWKHEDFLAALDQCRARVKYPRVRAPSSPARLVFRDIRLLVLRILRDTGTRNVP